MVQVGVLSLTPTAKFVLARLRVTHCLPRRPVLARLNHEFALLHFALLEIVLREHGAIETGRTRICDGEHRKRRSIREFALIEPVLDTYESSMVLRVRRVLRRILCQRADGAARVVVDCADD